MVASSSNTDTTVQAQLLRDQETALVKLGEIYRDQKCVLITTLFFSGGVRADDMIVYRNPTALSQIITQSRGFMSSTAKAKTAKLIRTLLDFFNAVEGSEEVQKVRLFCPSSSYGLHSLLLRLPFPATVTTVLSYRDCGVLEGGFRDYGLV
jgi:26S proteasome regulatory subunit RPN6 N-terminal domain